MNTQCGRRSRQQGVGHGPLLTDATRPDPTRPISSWIQPDPTYHKLNKKAQLTQGLRATAVRVYRHLGFLKFESCTISSAVPENPTLEPNSIARRSANRLRSYGHFCISKMAVSRHLGFYPIGNRAIRSAFPENLA